MKLKALAVLVAVSLGNFALAKPKPTAPCKVYFTAIENDSITRGVDLQWLNAPQAKWYEKHGDKGKFVGICYSKDLSDVPARAATPVYEILWGQEPFTYNYTTTETATTTDENGNDVGETDVPVTHTGTSYHGNALMLVWNPSQNKFIPVDTASSAMGIGKALGKKYLAGLSLGLAGGVSASTQLLENAMREILVREKERLAPSAKK